MAGLVQRAPNSPDKFVRQVAASPGGGTTLKSPAPANASLYDTGEHEADDFIGLATPVFRTFFDTPAHYAKCRVRNASPIGSESNYNRTTGEQYSRTFVDKCPDAGDNSATRYSPI